MELDSAYWNIVAMGIDAEDAKIGYFLPNPTQNHSRGIAREAILRSLLVAQTPDPFVVSTGFVYGVNPAVDPKQCDALVYDPRKSQPLYQLDEFVVVSPAAYLTAIEVKSEFGAKEFDDLMEARRRQRPFLGFAFDGVSFETFVKYLADAAPQMKRMPDIIAVHRKNYLGIRATSWREGDVNKCYLAIDFSGLADPTPGRATGAFLSWYTGTLRDDARRIHDGGLHYWFNGLPAARTDAKVVIGPDGSVNPGATAMG